MDPHIKDKMLLWLSFLENGNPHTWERWSLYWDGALVVSLWTPTLYSPSHDTGWCCIPSYRCPCHVHPHYTNGTISMELQGSRALHLTSWHQIKGSFLLFDWFTADKVLYISAPINQVIDGFHNDLSPIESKFIMMHHYQDQTECHTRNIFLKITVRFAKSSCAILPQLGP